MNRWTTGKFLGIDRKSSGITLGLQKYPLTWGYCVREGIRRTGERTPTGTGGTSLRATPSGRAKGKTALVHEAEATPAGREATLRSDEHRATGAASGGARLRSDRAPVQPGRRAEGSFGHRVTGLPGPRAARHRPRPRGHPNCSRGTIRFGGVIERWHGQPGQRERRQELVRATGAGSSFGNGGRFADKTGSEGHRTGQPVVAPTAASRATGDRGQQRASPASVGLTGDVRSSEG